MSNALPTYKKNENDDRFFIKNHRGQKVTQNCSRAGKKKKNVNVESYTQWKYPSGMKEKSRYSQMKNY